MVFKSFLLVLATGFVTISAYDIGCIYPQSQKNKTLFDLRNEMIGFGTDTFVRGFMETPMVVHDAHYRTVCQAMCLAYHAPGVLDPITKEETLFTVPDYGQNGWSITMCNAQCLVFIARDDVKMADSLLTNQEVMINYLSNDLDFMVTAPDQDIKMKMDMCDWENDFSQGSFCNNDCVPICDLLLSSEYNPYNVGQVAGWLIMDLYEDDGWNTRGNLQYDKETGNIVPCTANCRFYQDTTGYEPVPNPRTYPYPPINNDTGKYECTGLCRRWQPLQEGDDDGVLRQQEFVAPHIGPHAHWFLRQPTITLTDPMYDLYNQSLDVIAEVAATAGNNTRRSAVRLMDDKLTVRKIFQSEMRKQYYNDRLLSFEDYLLFLHGFSTAEYDAIIQAWHEKAYHDLVRPTTIIKHWDDDDLTTYGGDDDILGPVDIKARDFEAYIRVMPHAEFPSGSSCLCTAYHEFADLYTTLKFNSNLTDFTFNFEDQMFYFENTDAVRDLCGVSRLWGGMHYTEAVPAGEQICSGLGQLAIDYVEELRNGEDLSGGYLWGNQLPACPS